MAVAGVQAHLLAICRRQLVECWKAQRDHKLRQGLLAPLIDMHQIQSSLFVSTYQSYTFRGLEHDRISICACATAPRDGEEIRAARKCPAKLSGFARDGTVKGYGQAGKARYLPRMIDPGSAPSGGERCAILQWGMRWACCLPLVRDRG